MSDIELLNKQFAISNKLQIEDHDSGFAQIVVNTDQASARISLLGANLFHWQPRGQDEVIWLSTDTQFALGKSIRGGIPICWPCFAEHPTRDDFPFHGFARNTPWQLNGTSVDDNGEIEVELTTRPIDSTEAFWPQAELSCRYRIGEKLRMDLTTTNTGDTTFELTQALHTYFHIADIDRVEVTGLEERYYLDKTDDFRRKQQQGPIRFDGLVDRIYLDTPDTCRINDPVLNRVIRIDKAGSQSTVVWNPGEVKAGEMGDLGHEGYRQMVCVETANADADSVDIKPGESHTLSAIYQIE